MSGKELRESIHSLIDAAPDDILRELLAYLQTLESFSKLPPERRRILMRIIEEDDELLKRLAQ